MKQKKILFITHYTELYGANRSLLMLLGGFKDSGYDVYLLSPLYGPVVNEAEKTGCKSIVFFFFKCVHYNKKFSFFKIPIKRIFNFIRKHYFVIKYKNHHFDLVYSNSITIDFGILLSKQFGTPHVWHFRELGVKQFNFYYDLGEKFNQSLYSKSDALIAVSNSVFQEMLNNLNHANTHVIYNGVINCEYLSTKAICVNKPKLSFLSVGHINAAKNTKSLIHAFNSILKKFTNVELVFVGDGPQLKELKDTVSSLGISNHVMFAGYQESTRSFYQNADIFLMPAINEAFGRVTAEAMLYSLPVIGYNSGCTKELIIHGHNGFLYDDIDSLIEHMTGLCWDPTLIAEMGGNAFDFAKDKFTNQVCFNQVFKVVESLV